MRCRTRGTHWVTLALSAHKTLDYRATAVAGAMATEIGFWGESVFSLFAVSGVVNRNFQCRLPARCGGGVAAVSQSGRHVNYAYEIGETRCAWWLCAADFSGTVRLARHGALEMVFRILYCVAYIDGNYTSTANTHQRSWRTMVVRC